MKINDLVNCFPDGVLIINPCGEVIFSNVYASKICQPILEQKTSQSDPLNEVEELSRLFQTIRDGRISAERLYLLEGEFYTGTDNEIRVRVQMIELDQVEEPCLLIVLEDRKDTVRRAAIAEIRKFKLTPREADVWLWRRTGLSYTEIATKLFVTIDTVKKHLKSIYAKRDAMLWVESDVYQDWQVG